MKIGIVTLLGYNYGNRLQNYAVQELLKEYGEVFTVEYERKPADTMHKSRFSKLNPVYLKSAIDSRLLNIYHLSNRKFNTISRTRYYLKHKDVIKAKLRAREVAFLGFDEKHICYAPERLYLNSGAEDWIKVYDVWVCGSDQIWNPNYPTCTRIAFLQFADEQRRIALSPSIGLSNSSDMPEEYKKWIDGIRYLSVREEAAGKIVRELTGRDAEVFLDPTMILPIEKWEQIAEKSDAKLPGKYALLYFLGKKERSYVDFIDGFIATKGIDRVDILDGEHYQYLDMAPDQLVDAIRKAEVTFVDSFHGAVFSILFHKQFVVFERREDGKSMNSRVETLLKRFGLEDRVYSEDNVDVLKRVIDYSKIDAILMQERKRVKDFLDNAISEIRELPKENISSCRHIDILLKEQCCGCTACVNACPIQCIAMAEDEEGFPYANVDESNCIGCGSCRKVCPILSVAAVNEPQKVLAVKNKKEGIRGTSSSGGVFYEIAKKFIEEGGVVYGCALDANMIARHIGVENPVELERLKSSKYVQSDMGTVLQEIKRKLDCGQRVLFSGTPCQCAGLRNYLQKEYSNLFVVDILCHGVPSPKLFKDYLKILSAQYGGNPVSVNFRNKRRGWKRLYMEVRFDNGKRHYIYSRYDRYEGLFLNNMSLRPSCHVCRYTKTQRVGDITLGDFWGIGKKYPQWDDDKGISAVMLNTAKGISAYEKISDLFEGREESLEFVKHGQRTLYAPSQKNPNRDAFYKLLSTEGTGAALDAYIKVPSKATRAYYAVMRWGLDIVRKAMKKGF